MSTNDKEKQKIYQQNYFKKMTKKQRKAWKAKSKVWAHNNYVKNKAKRIAMMAVYYQDHKAKINEQSRQRKYTNQGLTPPTKRYSFYRDVILKLSVNDPMWQQLLSLPLTKRQIEIVEVARQGGSQKEQAKKLNIIQSNVSKSWNGCTTYTKCGKSAEEHGGIYHKWLKHQK